jgi:hypothetical protein
MFAANCTVKYKIYNQNDEFTVKSRDRHTHTETHRCCCEVCVWGETQRLREKGLMEEAKETKSFYRGPNVGVKWRPEF